MPNLRHARNILITAKLLNPKIVSIRLFKSKWQLFFSCSIVSYIKCVNIQVKLNFPFTFIILADVFIQINLTFPQLSAVICFNCPLSVISQLDPKQICIANTCLSKEQFFIQHHFLKLHFTDVEYNKLFFI